MKYDEHERDRARELRREMTEAEKILWNRLRDHRRSDLKFRRQHPLGPFTADFWCAAARVVVELDGAVHDDRKEFDAMRDAWMQQRRIVVLRFANDAVSDHLDEVLTQIERTCLARLNAAPHPNPLPEKMSLSKTDSTSGRGDQTPLD